MYGFPPIENHSSKSKRSKQKIVGIKTSQEKIKTDSSSKSKRFKGKSKTTLKTRQPSKKGKNPTSKRSDGVDPEYRFSIKDIMQQRFT
jgi:hypothetical protein